MKTEKKIKNVEFLLSLLDGLYDVSLDRMKIENRVEILLETKWYGILIKNRKTGNSRCILFNNKQSTIGIYLEILTTALTV